MTEATRAATIEIEHVRGEIERLVSLANRAISMGHPVYTALAALETHLIKLVTDALTPAQ